LNVRFWRSKDGGKTYDSIRTPHVDHHDLWIAPEDPLRMIVGDDGGGQCSVNGGESWSRYTNQPTAQFYRVTVDNVFPYRIYGAQQDNSTVRIAHRSGGGFIGERDWEPTAGGESGHIAPHPEDPDIVYGGSYGGFLTMYNHRTEEVRAVNVWPDNPMGMGAGELKYRFQWNFPIFFSPHDSNVLYTTGNIMFKTTNGGQSWDPISPDLTRNDPSTLGSSGGPITKDNTSVEYYATIFAAEESPHEKGVIWAGSDDGLLHITRDGGENWTNVTPSGMPEWMQINSIEIHPTEPGGLYVAGTRYKSDDFAPYLYKTTNYGSSWKKITRGIDPTHFTRVIRADPERAGLLYAGTESGLYISLDDGESWRPFQRNLPIVPITDLAVTNRDLVVATQGRSFWVMDDLSTVHQLSDAVLASKFHLFTPRPTYRMGGGGGRTSMTQGTNPRNGVYIDYHLTQAPKDSSKVVLRVLEENGDVIKSFTHKEDQLPLEVGSNRFVWNMRYEDAERFDGIILWGGGLTGPKAVPGFYKARLVMEDDSLEVPFEIKIDPRIQATELDLQATFDFQMEVRDKLTEVHKTIKAIRSVRDQINTVNKGVDPEHAMKDSLESVAKEVLKEMKEVEEALYQTKNQSNQDPLNYPIRLNNRLSFLSSLSGYGDFSPTDQTIAVQEEVTKLIDEQLRAWRSIRDSKIPEFNDLVKEAAIPAVVLQP
ncbi:MAG: glycosyl hydrolase, partial [Candidatus Eisenbacteria bacterium]|nr:glycosyl hydrolase [Candidatus Eisenbacteria bacterium]